jgi:hypothetical protein
MLYLPTILHGDTSKKIGIFVHNAIIMSHLRIFCSVQHDWSLCMLVKGRGCWYLVGCIVVGVGQDSWDSKVTRYGLDGPGIKSCWGQDFPHCLDRPWGPPSLLYSGYQVSSLGWSSWCVALTTTPIQRRGWRKSRGIPLLPFWAFVACSRVNCIFLASYCSRIQQSNVQKL